MMVQEGWAEWNIIPEYTFRGEGAGEIDVVHFEESLRTGWLIVSLVIAAHWNEPGGDQLQRGAWRVTFEHTIAYRKRPYDAAGNLALTRTPDHLSVWEIFPSNYLETSSAPSGISRYGRRVHHYVVFLNSLELYEVIAEGATSERIGQEWAYTFSNQPVPRIE